MAHNLNVNKKTNKVSFFSVKENPWHGLGTILKQCPTSEEAIIEAGLDFTVEKTPNFAKIGGKMIETPGSFSTYRTDTKEILGDKVGKLYTVVQNKEAFTFFDSIVGEGEAIYQTAGALGNGETIFITAKLPEYIKVGKDDIEKYLMLTMAHDGSGAIKAMFTPVRVVCQNTLQAALRGSKHCVSIKHTKSAQDNLKIAHEVLGITNQLSKELQSAFSTMSKTKMTDKKFKSYIEDIFLQPTELAKFRAGEKEKLSTRMINQFDDILAYRQNGPGQKEIAGTVWGAYNAVTGFWSNVKNFDSDEARVQSNYFGTGDYYMKRAFTGALELIK